MLPVFRRFSQSDIPSAPDWMGQVFVPLNTFCEQTVQTLNKNLTFGANVQGQKYTVTFTTLSDYATGGFTPITWQYTSGGQPNCLLVGQVTGPSLILTPITVTSWALNINTNPAVVQVNYIAGLTASTKYTITLLVV